MVNLSNLDTEQQNINSLSIDIASSVDILKLINKEDEKITKAVNIIIPQIAAAVDLIVYSLSNNGRLIYIGAGTSGRLGILDASECPPTFGTAPGLVKALIAGGPQAVYSAQEGAEDNTTAAISDLKSISFSQSDILVGISASGRTPYVLSAMKYAKQCNAKTISLSCSKNSQINNYADIALNVICGPEVITGSTRMKAGTAQKMVLNMLSTATMIRLGKVYKNLMIDVRATNEKLKSRALRIVQQATNADEAVCLSALEEANGQVRLAIFMILSSLSINDAKIILKANNGNISKSLLSLRSSPQ